MRFLIGATRLPAALTEWRTEMRRFFLIVLISLLPFLGIAQNREYSYPETWMQFTPAVFHLGAAELGLKCESSFAERAVTATFTVSPSPKGTGTTAQGWQESGIRPSRRMLAQT